MEISDSCVRRAFACAVPDGAALTFAQVETVCDGFNGNVDVGATLEVLTGRTVESLVFLRVYVPVNDLIGHLADTNPDRVEHLAHVADQGNALPPVLVWGSFVIDGNHRVLVADSREADLVPAFRVLLEPPDPFPGALPRTGRSPTTAASTEPQASTRQDKVSC